MADVVQFGAFTAVLPEGDLYKGKTRIRLQQHPTTLLLVLLERAGDIVRREEIRARVWPNGTLVEFDHGINTAMNRLRAALGDSAERPRYIETVARRGYRFITPVRRSGDAAQPTPAPAVPDPGVAPGAVISHYRIEKIIGSGAVGNVYEALDLNLRRRVALKFLTEASLSDASATERFDREARTIAALDHPNICGTYEFDSQGGQRFLAMQLLEGETLCDRIARQGRLEPGELLQFATQVSRGLEAAHERGIIHRDIKPSNLFVTRSGQVKILDFGIAKLAEAETVEPNGPGPLPGARTTAAGALMGTAAYMSPEQIQCLSVDHRTDIFSFGLVLYEMATGQHPFASTPDAEVTHALVHQPLPSPADRNRSLHPSLASVIERTLVKDRNRRIQSIKEVRELLESTGTARLRSLKPAIAATAVIGALAIGALAWRAPSGTTDLTVIPVTSSPGLKEHLAVSPDGSQIAFAWYSEGDNEDIFVQPVNSHTPVRLTTSPSRDFSPAWSGDGHSIAFLRTESGRTGYFIIPATGGPERKVGEVPVNPAPFCRQLDWSRSSGHLVVTEWKPSAEGGPALVLLSEADGTEIRRYPTGRGDLLCTPSFSPDGRSLAFLKGPDFRVADVYVVPVTGGPERRVTSEARMMQGLSWAPDGTSIVYSLRRSGPFGLWQVPANGGASRPVLETGNDVVDPHWSGSNPRLIFVRDMWDTNLWRVEGPEWEGPRSGPVKLLASTREESSVDVSPDGTQIVFASARTGAFELWLARTDGVGLRRLTHFNGPETGYPRWSPDGKRIAFNSYPDGQPAIFVVAAEGGRAKRRADGEMPFWSQDGNWVYYLRNHGGSRGLWRVPAHGGDAVRVADAPAAMAALAADGQSLILERGDNVWRRALNASGPGEMLVRGVAHGNWAAAPGGLCYLRYSPAASFGVECLNLHTGQEKRVASLGTWPRVYGPPAFAVSADGKWVFYGRTDQLESNIMLALPPRRNQ